MRRSSLIPVSVVAIAMMATTGLTRVLAHDSPPPGGTENHVDLKEIPKKVRQAEAQGYQVPPPAACVPGMGRHASKFIDGVRQMPLLLFDNKDDLVGIEFTTNLYPDDPAVLLNEFSIDLNDPSTWPVQVPPWEGPVGPHPGWTPNTLHWDLHIYTVTARQAEKSCK
ncbi:MAG: hypothetical protein HY268_26115 [Deltaproteobacteria bacterium]|nr:hypothetical protein [Deltaproteobacteria bacterium]